MQKNSLLKVIDFIEIIIDDLENDLVPLDEIANTQEDVEKMIVLQTKIDTLAQLILDLMSFEWDEE